MRCFARFGTMKCVHGGVLLLVKVHTKAYNFPKSYTPPQVFFTFFKLYKWYQIAQLSLTLNIYPNFIQSFVNAHLYGQQSLSICRFAFILEEYISKNEIFEKHGLPLLIQHLQSTDCDVQVSVHFSVCLFLSESSGRRYNFGVEMTSA